MAGDSDRSWPGGKTGMKARARIGAAMAGQPVGMFLPVARLVKEGLPEGADLMAAGAITAVLSHMRTGRMPTHAGLRVCTLRYRDDDGQEWDVLGVFKMAEMSD